MKFLSAASLLQLLFIFLLRSARNDGYVEGAVGLYGPDRYEGLPEFCLQPMDIGYCRAKIQRYYFDIRRMKCNMFFWGGCAGNDNNFKSLDECNDFCATTGGGYQETNSIVPTKRERVVNTPIGNENNSNINSKFTRGSKVAASKFNVKNAPSFRDNNNSSSSINAGTHKASAKSFNINPPAPTTTKQLIKNPITSADNFADEEEEYEE